MAGLITKLGVGLLLMGLVLTTGFVFLIDTANLNGITTSSVQNLNNYENKSLKTRELIHNSSDLFAGSDFETEKTDTAQLADSFKSVEKNLNFWTIMRSFLSDFSRIIPLSTTFLSILGGVLGFLLLMAALYFFWGRTP